MTPNKKLPYYFEDSWMDSPLSRDPFLSDPAYRVSTRQLEPGEHRKPVILCAHGFTASTYEWEEFRGFAEAQTDILVANLLLGGHGRSIFDFQKSTWQQWGEPVLAEYRALAAQGFEHLNLIGSSTGGTLLLYFLLSGAFAAAPAPDNLILIDPFLDAADRLFYFTPLASLFIKNISYSKFSEEEKKYWYVNRPSRTLLELYNLVRMVKRKLNKTVWLSGPTRITVYRSQGDPVVHPHGVWWLTRRIREADGRIPEIRLVDSKLHVFTRLQGRKTRSEADVERQQTAFAEILKLIRPAQPGQV